MNYLSTWTNPCRDNQNFFNWVDMINQLQDNSDFCFNIWKNYIHKLNQYLDDHLIQKYLTDQRIS